MICPQCGFDNIQGVDECANCGFDLASVDIPSPSTSFEAELVDMSARGPASPQATHDRAISHGR